MKIRNISPSIKLHYNPKGGEATIYHLSTDGDTMAQLNFILHKKQYALAHHTITQPAYQGMGLARKLVNVFFDFCHEHRLIIRATCSFVLHQMEQIDFPYPELLEDYDNSKSISQKLQSLSSPEQVKHLSRFFKTAPGEYSFGDIFLGIRVPDLRRIAKEEVPCTRGTLLGLIQSPYHDCRWLGFFFLTERMRRTTTLKQREEVYKLFITVIEYCNNWDLVDNFGSLIVGMYWYNKPPKQRLKALEAFAHSGELWQERIAIVGTQYLIQQGFYEDTFHLSRLLINHPHDLIHKAIGWMLREVGKQVSMNILREFLDEYASILPRTALRYSLEHFNSKERQHYMLLKRE